MHAPADMKFVTLGVTAEIVMVLNDENFRLGILPAVEIRRRQAADAAAHHDEIVTLVRGIHFWRLCPEIAVAQFMRAFERAGMAAAHAQSRGWIVIRRVLRFGFGLCGGGQFRRQPRHRHADGRALQEIAPRDLAAHAQFLVRFFRHDDP